MPAQFERTKISLEFRKVTVNSEVTFVASENSDALDFRMVVQNMKSPIKELKYAHTCALVLEHLTIPASNDDSERVFI